MSDERLSPRRLADIEHDAQDALQGRLTEQTWGRKTLELVRRSAPSSKTWTWRRSRPWTTLEREVRRLTRALQGGLTMWVKTDQDKLVSLEHVEQIIMQGDEVNAIFAGSSGQRQVRLAQAEKTVKREQYFGAIAAALDGHRLFGRCARLTQFPGMVPDRPGTEELQAQLEREVRR